jgi:hypothetical protein
LIYTCIISDPQPVTMAAEEYLTLIFSYCYYISVLCTSRKVIFPFCSVVILEYWISTLASYRWQSCVPDLVMHCVTESSDNGPPCCHLGSYNKGKLVTNDGVNVAPKKSSGYHIIDFGCEHGPTALPLSLPEQTIQLYGHQCLHRPTWWPVKLSHTACCTVAFALKDTQTWLSIIFNIKPIISLNKIQY